MRRFQFNLMKFYYSTIAVARDVKTFPQCGQGGITVLLLTSVEIGESYQATNEDDMLKQTNVTYLTRGAASLDDIPGVSTDFFWPQAKLKHEYHNDFPGLLRQLRRSMRLHNIGVHRIDFRDYQRSAPNGLGFSHEPWGTEAYLNGGININWFRSDVLRAPLDDVRFDAKIFAESYWRSTSPYCSRAEL